jgi:hypothetical protein
MLRFYRKEGENGEYFVQGFNESGEVVVQSKMTFEE